MSMGSREGGDQPPLWVTTSELARGEGHLFYRLLNELLGRHGFDPFVERLVEEKKIFAATLGRPSIPSGTYVERLKAKRKDVQLTEYPGAAHFFDARALKKPVKLDKAQTTRGCRLAESPIGVIVNANTQQPFTYVDHCVEHGPTLAYDEKASTEARKAVNGFVTTALRP